MKRLSLFKITDNSLPKFAINYSKLKYGCGTIATLFGKELANKIFKVYKEQLSTKKVVIYESAYQNVQNAASLILDTLFIELNTLMVEYNGEQIYRGKINRCIPYVQDYGKVSLEERVKLLSQDTFTFDYDFAKDKINIFLDDIYITGTHERKIIEMLNNYNIDLNNCISVYYAELVNNNVDPSFESNMNSAYVKSYKELATLINTSSNYKIIIRTLKMILSMADSEFEDFMSLIEDKTKLNDFYKYALLEGYHKIPQYQNILSKMK